VASIENRSRFIVTVRNRDDLSQSFAYNREAALKTYVKKLKDAGYKPKLTRTNDSFAIRIRQAGHRTQCLYASSEQEAVDMKLRLELERKAGLFVDYAKGRSVTLADLMARYLREESPRHKGFEVEGYIINATLEDAGLPRVDLEEAYEMHQNPRSRPEGKSFSKRSGRTMRVAAPATCFIGKPFADVVPDDFQRYIDNRCQSVEGLRAAQGVLGLLKPYGAARLEAACQRALAHDSPHYRTVKTILKTGADLQDHGHSSVTASAYAGANRFTRAAAELFADPSITPTPNSQRQVLH
jgi:hypothetical protein